MRQTDEKTLKIYYNNESQKLEVNDMEKVVRVRGRLKERTQKRRWENVIKIHVDTILISHCIAGLYFRGIWHRS